MVCSCALWGVLRWSGLCPTSTSWRTRACPLSSSLPVVPGQPTRNLDIEHFPATFADFVVLLHFLGSVVQSERLWSFPRATSSFFHTIVSFMSLCPLVFFCVLHLLLILRVIVFGTQLLMTFLECPWSELVEVVFHFCHLSFLGRRRTGLHAVHFCRPIAVELGSGAWNGCFYVASRAGRPVVFCFGWNSQCVLLRFWISASHTFACNSLVIYVMPGC